MRGIGSRGKMGAMGALVRLSFLPLLLLALTATRPAVLAAPVRMECGRWSWESCLDIGGGVRMLMLNENTGGGMHSNKHFVSGHFSIDMKLPKGNSGGTIFSFYLMDTITQSNQEFDHSEIDIEFYGNTSSKLIQLSLNVYADGHQNLAQFSLPWDPSDAFHKYGIQFNKRHIIWFIDGWPIRIINRVPGKPWPRFAMRTEASVWASTWTPLQADLSKGSIGAMYSNFEAHGCPSLDTTRIPDVTCRGFWDAPLPAEMHVAYRKLYAKHKLTDYGWDKVVKDPDPAQ